jgi:hypothetical protein
MATPQLSPGVLTREVDLTVGRADNILDNIAAISGPFTIGPVLAPIDINTEQELINVFGKPQSTDAQYEYWMSASSFLSYGGILKVVRTDGETLNNANASIGSSASNDPVKIKNFDDYNDNWSDDTVEFVFAAKNPGTWANTLKVCVIDDKADQTVGISTTNPSALGIVVGYGVTVGVNSIKAGSGSTSLFTGYVKGIITGVSTSTLGQSSFDVKIVSRYDSVSGVESQIDYAERDRLSSFNLLDDLNFINNSGGLAGVSTYSVGVGTTGQTEKASLITSVDDWYDEQTIRLKNGTVFWKSIAPKPSTNNYSLERNGKNDAFHIAIFDDEGKVTGIQGNLLEKHIGISKAIDSISAVNSPQKIWWKNYLANFSDYVFAGANPSDEYDSFNNVTPTPAGFTTYNGIAAQSFIKITTGDGIWNQLAQDNTFSSIGNVTYELVLGQNYDDDGGYETDLSYLIEGYELFSNRDEVEVDYILNGPSLGTIEESQAKAAYLINLANQRKDCIACISPHRGSGGDGVVGLTNSDTQTNNIIKFFSSLPSSSYAVFDSGYKYTYDRFNNIFRYIPCNPDIAGLMVRTSIEVYPWYSPAGQQRGILNNAIKLAYNPNKAQRDQLYPKRINSVINQPGLGVLLFGDKTALGYQSAFDRINVRRLFLTVEQALEKAAQAQLFELNDELTRSNFINIVEPYLRDIQAKRGVYDFLVICDQSNNTPDIIDNNEFRADIYLKPTKSINFVTLTFVATRTGVSFEEVAGRF